MFYSLLGSSRLTSCFCGIAGIRVPYHVLNALAQYQTSGLPLWGRPSSCLLSCFTYVGAVSGQRLASAGASESMFSNAFYMHWWKIKLATCFCGIARIHVFSCVLHVLEQYQTCELPPVQYQTSELLLRDRPNSCLLLCSTRTGAVSGWRVASAGS